MYKEITLAKKILKFNEKLSKFSIDLPNGYKIINPFNRDNKKIIFALTEKFYETYYNDNNKRRLIFGSSPVRCGTATSGVSFEDALHLKKETGILIDNFHVNNASSNFLYDVIDSYGGSKKFYSNFYMNFVFPLGIVKTNLKGNDINYNYYENKKLKEILYSSIVKFIKIQLSFGIDTSVCYCIGSGENFKFLTEINNKYNFFNEIIPLEHPRFIMQYNSKRKVEFQKKYLNALKR